MLASFVDICFLTLQHNFNISKKLFCRNFDTTLEASPVQKFSVLGN